MTQVATSADPAQRDITWSGYHPRAMAPALGLATLVSLSVWTGRWYFEEFSDFADRVGALVVFALGWAVWPALVAVFIYRTVTYTYRLTDRALLIDFGFLASPVPSVALGEVTTVAVGGNLVTRWLGIGRIEVRTHDRAIRLPGVRRPELLAIAIREASEKARSGH